MAKIVFMNIPAHGHVNPTLPVVQELIRREHEVIYYNTPEFSDKIAYTGAEFRPYPEPNPTAAEISGKAEKIVNFSLLMLAETQRLLPTVLAEVARERPHVLRHALPHVPRLLKLRRQLVHDYGDAVFPAGDIFPALGKRNLLFTSRQFQGLYFGVPLVVAPQQFEQMFNGRRVVAHGAGIMVNDRPPYGRVNGDELRTAMQSVLAAEAYGVAARRIGDSLQQAGGYRRAADELDA